MSARGLYLICLTAGLMVLTTVALAEAQQAPVSTDTMLTSDNRFFIVSYTSKLQPIVINQIHSWVIHVETPDGSPVNNATISLSGGMPAHAHGLPTMPQATQYLGNGDYLVEGIKFHMNGLWQITVSLTVDAGIDSVTFDLQL